MCATGILGIQGFGTLRRKSSGDSDLGLRVQYHTKAYGSSSVLDLATYATSWLPVLGALV